MPDKALVVLPTYNEAANLVPMISAIVAAGCRVLVVDDASPDGTGRIADGLAATDPAHVAVLHRTEKAGLGPAYAAGFRQALREGPDVICQMDADFSHDPGALPDLIAAVRAGADVAIGSRYVEGGGVENWPWHRRALSRGGNIYAGVMLGTSIGDMTAGYRAFAPSALEMLEPWTCNAAGYGFQIEMAWRAAMADLDVVEIPITFRDRIRGESKMDARIAFEAIGLVTKWGIGRVFGRLPWSAHADRSPTSV